MSLKYPHLNLVVPFDVLPLTKGKATVARSSYLQPFITGENTGTLLYINYINIQDHFYLMDEGTKYSPLQTQNAPGQHFRSPPSTRQEQNEYRPSPELFIKKK